MKAKFKTNYVVGELVHPESSHVLRQTQVDSYNAYYVEINRMIQLGRVKAVECLRDNAHKYFRLCID